jgi:hypothetical protein
MKSKENYMKKNNRISINAYEKYLDNHSSQVLVVENFDDIEVNITPMLSLVDMMKFVDAVSEFCFSDEGKYLPELKDFAIRCNILESYTNFTLPANIEKRYNFVCRSGEIINFILERVDQDQFRRMIDAIDERIEKKAMSEIYGTVHGIGDIASTIEKLRDMFDDVVAGIDKEEIAELIKNIAKGTLEDSTDNNNLEESNDTQIEAGS